MVTLARRYAVLLVAISALACAQTAGTRSTVVYATKSGTKYHREGCRYLVKSKIRITLADAAKRHLEPCKVCKPPVVGKG